MHHHQIGVLDAAQVVPVFGEVQTRTPARGRGRELVAPLGAPHRNRRLSCSLLWSWRVSGSQLSRRTVRAKSVRFASSAQAETGEAETQESERAGFRNGSSGNARHDPAQAALNRRATGILETEGQLLPSEVGD
jgi:hypothetical protein